MDIHHNLVEQAFQITLDGHDGELTYARPRPDLLDFQHTWVDPALRGRGVADALAHAALTYARHEGAYIRTTCVFMASYVKRHPEWEALREKAA